MIEFLVSGTECRSANDCRNQKITIGRGNDALPEKYQQHTHSIDNSVQSLVSTSH